MCFLGKCEITNDIYQHNSKKRTAHLVNRNARPSLTPFDATNLNRLKISHLERRGIPCSICRLNWMHNHPKCSDIPVDRKSFTNTDNDTAIWIVIHPVGHSSAMINALTLLKLCSLAFANRDSCFMTTILSW